MTDPAPLKFGLFPSFFYRKDEASGALSGFGIEFARSFAQQLQRELVLREYLAPPAVVVALKSGACDVAFLGLDPARASDVDFSPAYLRADFTFLVPAALGIDRHADVDRQGLRIAVVGGHAMETSLRGKFEKAQRVLAPTPDEGFALLTSGKSDVLAGIRPGLLAYAEMLPGSRVLAERYGENVLALAVAKGRPDWSRIVSEFVTGARASGLLTRIIEESGLAGVEAVLS